MHVRRQQVGKQSPPLQDWGPRMLRRLARRAGLGASCAEDCLIRLLGAFRTSTRCSLVGVAWCETLTPVPLSPLFLWVRPATQFRRALHEYAVCSNRQAALRCTKYADCWTSISALPGRPSRRSIMCHAALAGQFWWAPDTESGAQAGTCFAQLLPHTLSCGALIVQQPASSLTYSISQSWLLSTFPWANAILC